MSDMKNKSVAVTGHRVLAKNFDENLLKDTFIKLLEEGFEYFYIGMALGLIPCLICGVIVMLIF